MRGRLAWVLGAAAAASCAVAACGGDGAVDHDASSGFQNDGGGGAGEGSTSSRGATSTTSSGSTSTAASSGSGGAGGSGGSCHGTFAAADRPRLVIVSHPFDNASGDMSPVFEAMQLETDGTLTRPGTTFDLARTSYGHVAFTPDGLIALVAEEDCTLGVVRFDAQGTPTVVHAALDLGFCPGPILIEPGAETALILDGDTRGANGGGIYRVSIACDGTVTSQGLLATGANPGGFALLNGNKKLIVAAHDLLDAPTSDVQLVDYSASSMSIADHATVFTGESIYSGIGVTHDEKVALVLDDDQFSGIMNRVGVVAIDGETLAAGDVLSPFDDPADIVTSPFDGGGAIVIEAQGNGIQELKYDASNAAHPFSIAGELQYAGVGPQLPESAVMVTRGALTGLVLISENVAIRRVQFTSDGGVKDLGPTPLGGGLKQIPGCIGVAP